MINSLETIFISDQVVNGKISLKTPIHKFQRCVWQLAIESVSFEILNGKSKIDSLCSLKCNWITNLSFNLFGQLTSQSPVLMQLFLSQKKNCFNSHHLNWFDINSLSETIVIDIINLSKNMSFDFNCKMNIIILVRPKA